jgi:hypothetical protein
MYGKIFESMYEGSMVGAGPTVFAVWGYCISKADIDGTVLLNPSLLAATIGTHKPEIEAAIEYLNMPDPNSKNPDHEGRRLLHLSGFQYFVVSLSKYRNIKSNTERREYMREYMRKRRATEEGDVSSLQSLPKLTDATTASAYASSSASPEGESREGGQVPAAPLVERTAPKTFKQWDREDLAKAVAEANKDGLLTPAEAKDFVGYWMEPSATGRPKMSYEKTWDTRRRMQTALRIIYSRSREGGGNRGFAQNSQPQPKRWTSI